MKEFFGVIVLETNLDKSADEVFKLYKKRWKIETFYNYHKNRLDVNALYLDGYYMTQGLSFIILITSLIYEGFKEKAKRIPGKNMEEILRLSRFVKLIKRSETWHTSTQKEKLRFLFATLNIELVKKPNIKRY